MTAAKTPFGQLRAKANAYCTICTCRTIRNLAANVYANTPEGFAQAKAEIEKKAAKPYTCRICSAILKA